MKKADVGILGALQPEVEGLIGKLKNPVTEQISGLTFHIGELFGKTVVIARCGIGKVAAATAAEAMVLRYSPALLINTGVAGAIAPDLKQGDIVVATELCQHDMDTSPLGDPKGFVSGINRIYFPADERALSLLKSEKTEGYALRKGIIASGDLFVSTESQKQQIAKEFSAAACEMEGCAIAQVAFVNATPCCVIRAISDGADEDARLSYEAFLPIAAARSAHLTEELIRRY